MVRILFYLKNEENFLINIKDKLKNTWMYKY